MAHPTITALPPAPVRGEDFETFAQKANDHVAALTPWTDEANALGSYIETTAATVDSDAAAAANSADSANQASSIATSSANFEGEWSSLTGSLSVPVSVYHDGRHWNLLNDLADVTTSEPGVSADWATIFIAESWTYIAASQTLDKNTNYEVDFTTGPFTLTLPASPLVNDFVQFYKGAGQSLDSVIARNGETIMGLAENLDIDVEITSLHLVYNGTDWRIVR